LICKEVLSTIAEILEETNNPLEFLNPQNLLNQFWIESVLDGTNQMCDYPFDGYRVSRAQILIG